MSEGHVDYGGTAGILMLLTEEQVGDLVNSLREAKEKGYAIVEIEYRNGHPHTVGVSYKRLFRNAKARNPARYRRTD